MIIFGRIIVKNENYKIDFSLSSNTEQNLYKQKIRSSDWNWTQDLVPVKEYTDHAVPKKKEQNLYESEIIFCDHFVPFIIRSYSEHFAIFFRNFDLRVSTYVLT